MRLRVLFTRHRSRPLAKPGRFENATKSEPFSKRYGLICYVHSKTASISIRLLFWREFSCIIRFKMVNLAHIAALAYTSTTSIFWRRRFGVNIPDHIDFDAVSKSYKAGSMWIRVLLNATVVISVCPNFEFLNKRYPMFYSWPVTDVGCEIVHSFKEKYFRLIVLTIC